MNRGGLFEINDMIYNHFKEIELKVRHHLFVSLHRKSSEGREAIIGAVCKCDNIQFYWTILSIDILEALRKDLKRKASHTEDN